MDEARGSNGFGYDPHFYLNERQRTLAQLTSAQKNTISHRGKAARAMRSAIERLVLAD